MTDALKRTLKALIRCKRYIWNWQILGQPMVEEFEFTDTDGRQCRMYIDLDTNRVIHKIEVDEDGKGYKCSVYALPRLRP